MSSIDSQVVDYENASNSGNYSGERLEAIKAHAAFLKSVKTKYANIDHWKIPYPSAPAL
jgi:hypothetical protein